MPDVDVSVVETLQLAIDVKQALLNLVSDSLKKFRKNQKSCNRIQVKTEIAPQVLTLWMKQRSWKYQEIFADYLQQLSQRSGVRNKSNDIER